MMLRILQWILYVLLFLLPIGGILTLIFSHKRWIRRIACIISIAYLVLYIFLNPYVAFVSHRLSVDDFKKLEEGIGTEITAVPDRDFPSETACYVNRFTAGYEFEAGNSFQSARLSFDIYRFASAQAAGGYYQEALPSDRRIHLKEYRNGEFKAAWTPVGNERPFIMPPLENTVQYSCKAIFQYGDYVVEARELTGYPQMKLGEALRYLARQAPDLEEWLTHDLGFVQTADGSVVSQNDEEVTPSLIQNR